MISKSSFKESTISTLLDDMDSPEHMNQEVLRGTECPEGHLQFTSGLRECHLEVDVLVLVLSTS
jgi:hypothetical protein